MAICGHVANLLAFPEQESPCKSPHLTDFIAPNLRFPPWSLWHTIFISSFLTYSVVVLTILIQDKEKIQDKYKILI